MSQRDRAASTAMRTVLLPFLLGAVAVLLLALVWQHGETAPVGIGTMRGVVPSSQRSPAPEDDEGSVAQDADHGRTPAPPPAAGHLRLVMPGHRLTTTGGQAGAPPAALRRAAVACGSGEVHSLGVRPTLLSGRAPFTIAAWIRLDDIPVPRTAGRTPYRTILSRQRADLVQDSFLFGVRIGTARELAFIFHLDDGHLVRVLGGAVATGTWHHVAVTRDATTIRLYLDGRSVCAHPFSGALPSAATPLILGANRNPAGFAHRLYGDIAALTIWHTALDAAAITRLRAGEQDG